jgi:hypothetical protein
VPCLCKFISSPDFIGRARRDPSERRFGPVQLAQLLERRSENHQELSSFRAGSVAHPRTKAIGEITSVDPTDARKLHGPLTARSSGEPLPHCDSSERQSKCEPERALRH